MQELRSGRPQGRRARARLVAVQVALLLAAPLVAVTIAPSASAADPCGPAGNAIACENSLPGTPSAEWDGIFGAGSEDIQGFATEVSVDAGNPVDFKIDTDAANYSVTIYRTGWYGGDGAREVATVTPSATLPQSQPECLKDVSTGLTDCGNWGVSATWNVPAAAVSGVYLARLEVPATGAASHITFIVRDDGAGSEVVFQTADTTWQAYNTYGLGSLYEGVNGRAQKVSYNRPLLTRGVPWGRDYYLANEFPMVRFLERNGYDVSYIAGVDSHRDGAELLDHEVFLSVGHDEYWSGPQRKNVEAARDAGVHLQFLSGNEVYWRNRYEPSIDGTNTPDRTLVTYKETSSNGKTDPSPEWTGTWRDPRFAPRSVGAGRAENGLTGTAYVSNYSDFPLTVNAREGKNRLWRNTSLASLSAGASAELAPHTVGYESNEDLDNGERPPGLVRLSTTEGDVPEYLQDFGTSVAPGRTTHHVTLYRAASGALVFGAGTVQWSWGLDAQHDSPYNDLAADSRMQQAQVNLFADMGVQPTTLMSGLQAATASTDTAAPVVTIDSPAAGAAVSNGTTVTVTGTASDGGGGRVAGVEVSTDGGASWHAADGTTSWSFGYIQHGNGATDTLVRAIDDSANIGPTASRRLQVSCPCSVYGATTPATPASSDTSSAELGLRFSPTSDGFVTGVRFYKGAGNGGTHVGSLWSSSGEQLATATFANESSTGWQRVTFNAPVAVAAGQTYVASYNPPQGRYAVQPWAFAARPLLVDPLEVAGGFGVAAAGVYAGAGQFPTSSYQNASYYVGPIFDSQDDSPLGATRQWPLPNSSSVPADTTISARFSKPMQQGTVGVDLTDALGQQVAGSTAYDATTRTVTFTPATPLEGFVKHTVTLRGTDQQGQPIVEGKTWSFTTVKPPGEPGVCPCTLFDDGTTPTLVEDVDNAGVTLGVRFSSEVDGTITGVKFYKGPNNTGSHVGSLWGAGGALLAQGTFTDETSTGWQTLTFDTPVAIQAGVEYVASYRAPQGRYSATPNAFSAGDLSRSPLQVGSRAGAYSYADQFPGTSSASSYLVDVVFERAVTTFEVVSTDPPGGSLDVPRSARVRLEMSGRLDTGWSLQVLRPDQTPVPGTTALAGGGTTIVFTPDGPMPAQTDLEARATGLRSTSGDTIDDVGWTFTTRGPDSATAQTLFSDQVPVVGDANDNAPVELGTVFSPTRDGSVTGIRFHKGPGNVGTHTGSLWDDTGARLAQVTFVGESDSGWQSATVSPAVPVTAGREYVVSYHAPRGHYSYTGGFFSSPFSNGDLSAPAGQNGRYLYGGGGLPVYSWGSTNYFVDVVFEPTPTTMAVTGRTPVDGATNVSRSVKPSVTFSAPVADGWSLSAQVDGQAVAGSATRGGGGRTLTFTPDAALPPSTTVRISFDGVSSADGVALAAESWTFTTGATTTTRLLDGETPQDISGDSSALELGMGFVPSVDGEVVAVQFYKGAGSTGTHTGSLWSADGTRLATVTFTDETASGWQRAALDSPVALSAGQEYVVSYYAPNGRYGVTPRYFDSERTVGPLTAGTTNGRYYYADGGGFPTGVFNRTNYFVDVEFRAQTP